MCYMNFASDFSTERKLEKRKAEKGPPKNNMIAVQKLEAVKVRNLFKQLSLLTSEFQ